MISVFLGSILRSEIGDSAGLLLFGIVLVGSSFLLRRVVATDMTSEQKTACVKGV